MPAGLERLILSQINKLSEEHPDRSLALQDTAEYCRHELARTGWLELLDEEKILPENPISSGDPKLDDLLNQDYLWSREEALNFVLLGRLLFEETEPLLQPKPDLVEKELLRRIVLWKGTQGPLPEETYPALRELNQTLYDAGILLDVEADETENGEVFGKWRESNFYIWLGFELRSHLAF